MEEVRDLPFMFLGGRLDHAIRKVRCDGPLMTPPAVIKFPVASSVFSRAAVPTYAPDRAPAEHYRRHRVTSGLHSWWCFVLEGHEPQRRHLMDASPFF